MSDFSHSWLPYLYQYGLGAVIFVVGLIITLKSGSFDLRRRGHRRWMRILLLGFIWYATVHAAMTLAALGYEGIALAVFVGVMGFSTLVAVALGRRARLSKRRR